MGIKRKYFSFLVSFCLVSAYGQQEESYSTPPDSLLRKSYEALQEDFNTVKNDSLKALYAKAYLEKSIADRDPVKQADAWYFLSLLHPPAVAERYADSIISLTENIEDDTYPARGFLVKGLALYRKGKYKEALDQWVKAYAYARENRNTSQQLEVTYQIGALKTDLGEHEDALAIFRSYLREAEKKYQAGKSNLNLYIKGLFALGDAYNRNKKYDSAAFINKKGFLISLENKDRLNAAYFTLSMGVTEYLRGNYNAALDSIRKVERALITNNDTANLTICYLYRGRIYREQGKVKESVVYFKKVDSLVQRTSDVFPDVRDAYEFLIDYYDEKKDLENQLKYIKHLLAADSLLNSNEKYIRKTLYKKYDTEELNRRKEEIIARQERDKVIWIVFLSLAVVFISTFAYYHYRKQRMYRLRLEALLHENGKEKKPVSQSVQARPLPDLSHIAPETLERVLDRLETFEAEKGFRHSDVSLNTLAGKWDTNSRYLTDIVRTGKGKNFKHYIRDLRIDDVVERLKTDSNFRRYTIEAIAEEAGFKTAGSFSRSFFTEKGVYPSHFISALKKRDRQRS